MVLISSLDDLYFYQNNETGQASSTAVSVRQLCKILSLTKTTRVTPETLVWSPSPLQSSSSSLSSDPETQGKNSWTSLKEIPVLKEACAEWYYTTVNPKTDKTTNSAVVGPVSIQQLHSQEHDIAMVYSANEPDRGWVPIANHPDLGLALRALDPVTGLPSYSRTGEEEPSDGTSHKRQRRNPVAPGMADEEEGIAKDEVQKELDAFLRSTGSSSGTRSNDDPQDDNDDDDDEVYQSDGGTNYWKDPISGKWIHEALVPAHKKTKTQQSLSSSLVESTDQTHSPNEQPHSSNAPNTKKKRTRAKFAARNAKCWIYVTGLPLDTDEDEVQRVFSKAGILDLDPETQAPKIKLYSKNNNEQGQKRVLKGDASLCFARPESIDLSIQLFHEAPFRIEDPTSIITVERAKFEQRGDSYQKKAQSRQKRLVAKKAALQSIGWEENEDNGRITGGLKGLTIVVLKHMFTPEQATDDVILEGLERQIRTECSQWGTVTKITMFASNPHGIVLVRFKEPTAATTTIENLNGRIAGERKIEAHFWDGVTDYTVKDLDQAKHEEEARLEEFGEWLESQEELPDELQLKVEL